MDADVSGVTVDELETLPEAQTQGRHTTDGLEERGVEKLLDDLHSKDEKGPYRR